MAAFVAWVVAKCHGNKRLKLEDVMKMAGHTLAEPPKLGPRSLKNKTRAIMGSLAKKKNK